MAEGLEKIIVTQQRNFPAGSEFIYGAQDEKPDNGEPNACFDKFYHDAELRGFGLSPEGIAKEFAATGFEKRAEQIYRKTHGAGAAPPPADPQRLEKRYLFKGEKAHHLQKSENGKWMFEFSADNRLLRGYEIAE